MYGRVMLLLPIQDDCQVLKVHLTSTWVRYSVHACVHVCVVSILYAFTCLLLFAESLQEALQNSQNVVNTRKFFTKFCFWLEKGQTVVDSACGRGESLGTRLVSGWLFETELTQQPVKDVVLTGCCVSVIFFV